MGERKVFFVCERFPEYCTTLISEEFVEVEGRAVRKQPHRIQFVKRAFGGIWRGEYETDNPKEIEHLRSRDAYKSGYIYESTSPDNDDRVPPGGRVRQGLKDTGADVPVVETKAPEDAPRAPEAGVVAVKRRGRPKAVAA